MSGDLPLPSSLKIAKNFVVATALFTSIPLYVVSAAIRNWGKRRTMPRERLRLPCFPDHCPLLFVVSFYCFIFYILFEFHGKKLYGHVLFLLFDLTLLIRYPKNFSIRSVSSSTSIREMMTESR